MENSVKPKKLISQRIAEFFFTLYLITLYIFVDREETVIISKLVFILFAAFTTIAVLRSRSIHIGKNVMCVYLAFTWMFATVFWARNEHDATIMSKTMWQLFIQFFLTYNLFVKQSDAHEHLLRSLYVSGLVLIGYSLYVYGFSEIINAMMGDESVRLGTEINQQNSFGMMNATTVMVAFYNFLYKRRFKLFHVAVMASSFVLAMSSGSRKALLMMCVGILIMVVKKYGWKKLYKLVIVATLIIVAFTAVMKLPIFETVVKRMEGINNLIKGDGGDASAKARMEMIVDGWNVFKDRIVIGFGANNYKNVTRFKTYSHNNFIEVLVDFGLVGFALYYLIYFRSFKNLWRSQTDASKALFSIFLVRFLMEVALVTYYSKLHWVVMAFYLISIEKAPITKKPELEESDFAKEEIAE